MAQFRLLLRSPGVWVLLLLAVGALPCAHALRFMLDSQNEHYTPRGRCVLYKIPGHSLVTGEVTGVPPANGRIGVFVCVRCVASVCSPRARP